MITEIKLNEARALLPELIRRSDVMHNQPDAHHRSVKRGKVAPVVERLNILLTPFHISFDYDQRRTT